MKLCVALDMATQKSNLRLAEKLAGQEVWLKVGFSSFIRDGKPFLQILRQIDKNFKIFLDLKLYDIPNTMADAAESIAEIGVDMFNVHASAGVEGMRAVADRLAGQSNRPLILAVTALTSFDKSGFFHVYNAELSKKALDFAVDAKAAGMDGVVCSVLESREIKNMCGEKFFTLCPGIRPTGAPIDDQKRTATVEDAKVENVDFIVVGRPIYKSEEPAKVAKQIIDSL